LPKRQADTSFLYPGKLMLQVGNNRLYTYELFSKYTY